MFDTAYVNILLTLKGECNEGVLNLGPTCEQKELPQPAQPPLACRRPV